MVVPTHPLPPQGERPSKISGEERTWFGRSLSILKKGVSYAGNIPSGIYAAGAWVKKSVSDLGKALTGTSESTFEVGVKTLLQPEGAEIPAKVSPYLTGYLQHFALHDYGQMHSKEEVDAYWSNKLEAFNRVCNEYQEARNREGKSEIEIASEIETAKQMAAKIASDEKKKAADIIKTFNELTPIPGIDEPSIKSMLQIIPIHALLLEISEKPLGANFLSNSQNYLEDHPELIKARFAFLQRLGSMVVKEGEECEGVHSELLPKRPLACFKDIVSGIDLFSSDYHTEFKNLLQSEEFMKNVEDMEPTQLFQEAEERCKPYSKCFHAIDRLRQNPLATEKILQELSPRAIAVLTDNPDYMSLLFEDEEMFCDLPKDVSRIEKGIAVIENLKKQGVSFQQISDILEIVIEFERVEAILKGEKSLFDPWIEILHMAPQALTELSQSSGDRRLSKFILFGGTIEKYKALESISTGISLTKRIVSLAQSFTASDLKNFIQIYSFLGNPADFEKIMEKVKDKEWCKFMLSIGAAAHDHRKEQEAIELYVWLKNPQQETAAKWQHLSVDMYLSISPEERYTIARYAEPRDLRTFFYCSEAAGHFEQDIASTPLSTIPTEPLVRFLGAKPYAAIKPWLEQTIDTPEGKKSRLETLSLDQKNALLDRFLGYDATRSLSVWMELLKIPEKEMAVISLSTIPTQLLLAFLEAKSAEELKSWLTGTILQGQKRFETISEEQKKALLIRCRYDDDKRAVLSELFQKSEQEIQAMAEEQEYLPDVRRDMILSTREDLKHDNPDTHDPVFVEAQNANAPYDLIKWLKDLFEAGEEESICGGRRFITWKGAGADKDACVSQDDAPLHVKYQNKDLVLYPRGAFTNIGLGVPGVSIRKRILDIYKRLGKEPLSDLYDQDLTELAPEEKELFYELVRIGDNLRERYPLLEAHMSKSPAPAGPDTQFSPKQERAKTFSELLKATYSSCVKSGMEKHPSLPPFDPDDFNQRYIFTFLSLVKLARKAKIEHEHGSTTVILSPKVMYRLKELNPDLTKSPTREDNPGMDNLFAYASDYPMHTISPITPMQITPKKFERFAASLKSLDESQFSDLCESFFTFLSHEKEQILTAEEILEKWKAYKPKGVDILSADWMAALAKMYAASMELGPVEPALKPNATYQFNAAGVDDFTPEEEIPQFIRNQGNFISALCKTYIPHNPDLHDGNCGVNSFLLGLHGPRAYTTGGRSLTADVSEFRRSIVDYCLQNRAALIEEFGQGPIDTLINIYASSCNEWTGREVWAIAARLYKREVQIFDCDGHGNLFKTNEKREVVPFDEKHEIFEPKDRVVNPPICLMFWGPHYCYLERKAE